jgi:hypothetical protein
MEKLIKWGNARGPHWPAILNYRLIPASQVEEGEVGVQVHPISNKG